MTPESADLCTVGELDHLHFPPTLASLSVMHSLPCTPFGHALLALHWLAQSGGLGFAFHFQSMHRCICSCTLFQTLRLLFQLFCRLRISFRIPSQTFILYETSF